MKNWDFPGSPLVKTSLQVAEGLIPGGETQEGLCLRKSQSERAFGIMAWAMFLPLDKVSVGV